MAQRFPKVIALRLSADVFDALKARAREDDRSLGTYVRRLIIAALK